MKRYLTIIFLLCLTWTAHAQAENATRLRNYNNDNGIAIKDFDPVSYFKGKAAKGSEKFAYTYKGLTYYFVNNENMEEFKKSPSKYEPAYGGWCAYSMAINGERVKVDPSTYKIINGKVYLFSNFNGKNNLRAWNTNQAKYKASADKLWVKKMH
ncbi:MAG TPA: YHS domain-containing (seleno)protein [Ohtaekwangia sp.]|uniref:YHS domain-containing (seleno)protein n=1 Tax=Ohtaekwangia sp. TaxID=2066019 RepID=UPI002F946A83